MNTEISPIALKYNLMPLQLNETSLEQFRNKNNYFYYIYICTNIKTNKIYVGYHGTQKLNDGYFGSGVKYNKDVTKLGKNAFRKEYLSFHSSKIEMENEEARIVDLNFIKDKNTYNSVLGGGDSFLHKITVKDKEGNIFQIDVNDTRFLNGELVGITKGKLKIIQDNKIILINCSDYNPDIHVTPLTNMVLAKHKETGITTQISKEEYKSNKHIFEHDSNNKVILRDIKTNKCIKVDKNEINNYNNTHKTTLAQKDEVYAIDLKGNKITISKEEFNKYKGVLYFGQTKGKMNVRNIHTGEIININKKDWDIYRFSKYIDFRSLSFNMVKCRTEEGIFYNVTKEEFNYGNHIASTKGMIIINNKKEQTTILPEKLQEYLKLGWVKGKLLTASTTIIGSIWINNQQENKRIKLDILEFYISYGWEQGRIKWAKPKKKSKKLLQ